MKLAMVFPGQGSQSVGMMRAYGDLVAVRDVLAEASDALGQDLAKLMAEGPAEQLNQTVNTQPVMLTAGYAAYRGWIALGGVEPALVAGHSLGEYTALVAAGVMSFRDALPLVRFRAQAMQEAVPQGQGAMAAVLGLDEDAMRPAAERLQQYLQSIAFGAPRIPVINNVDVASYAGAAQIKDALVRQAFNPVRWVETIRAFAQQGITHVAECGPGKVLAGMTKRIGGSLESLALSDRAGIEQGVGQLKGA